MAYSDETNIFIIQTQIDAFLQNKDAAMETLQIITELALELEPSDDPVSQWLICLNEEVPKARQVKTSDDLIEIYPSKTEDGFTRDRLLFLVEKAQVAVIKAYESDN